MEPIPNKEPDLKTERFEVYDLGRRTVGEMDVWKWSILDKKEDQVERGRPMAHVYANSTPVSIGKEMIEKKQEKLNDSDGMPEKTEVINELVAELS